MGDSLADSQRSFAYRDRAGDHRPANLVPPPERRAPRRGTRAYSAVRRVTRRVDPRRAWSYAAIGVIAAAWGAGVATLVLVAAGMIR